MTEVTYAALLEEHVRTLEELATLKAAARVYIKLEKDWRTDGETGIVAWWEKKQDALDALAALVGEGAPHVTHVLTGTAEEVARQIRNLGEGP